MNEQMINIGIIKGPGGAYLGGYFWVEVMLLGMGFIHNMIALDSVSLWLMHIFKIVGIIKSKGGVYSMK